MDGGRLGEATEILEEIWSDWPREARFGLNLIAWLGGLGRVEERGLAIERLALNARANFEWAVEELERLRPEAEEYGIKLPRPKVDSEGELAEESVTIDVVYARIGSFLYDKPKKGNLIYILCKEMISKVIYIQAH